jgi:hypothetical protein
VEDYEPSGRGDPEEIVQAAGYDPLSHLWKCPVCGRTPCWFFATRCKLEYHKIELVNKYPEKPLIILEKRLIFWAAERYYDTVTESRNPPSCILHGIQGLFVPKEVQLSVVQDLVAGSPTTTTTSNANT